MKRLVITDKEGIKEKIQVYFSGNEEAKFIHRLHGILLFLEMEDESCDSIGALFGNSPRTIRNWIKRVNETGDIESLRSKKHPGRPPRLSDEQRQELKTVIQEPPEKHGIAISIWDGKSLSSYISKRYNIVMKTRTCQRLFRQLGFSLKRARPVVSRADEEKKADSKTKLQEKIKSEDYEVFFEDECHFKLTLTIIRAWFLAGSCPEIKSPVERYKVSIFGAMGRNGQVITLQNERFNAETFRLFLMKLLSEAEIGRKKNGMKKKILLVLDNAKYHHAKILKPWLSEVSDLLELFFLPPYSPDLNPIEIFWKKTRRNVTHNRFFNSLQALGFDLKMYWKKFDKPNDELMKLSAFI
jgi:transposase